MFTPRHGLRAAVIGLLGLAFAVGCSSDRHNNAAQSLVGASGRNVAVANGLDLTANPTSVTFDLADTTGPVDPNHGNERYANVALHVLATDLDSKPQNGLSLNFSATGGALASHGLAVKTDTTGQADDTLRVYTSDPDSITASVTDGVRTSSVVIHKTVLGPPVANAGPDQTVPCTGDSSAQVTLNGSGSTDANNDIASYEWFEFYGTPQQVLLDHGQMVEVVLSTGTHTITLVVTDATGATSTDEVVVTVSDTEPPVVQLTMSPSKLWPPNHKLVNVHAALSVVECSSFTVTLESVSSNEPDNGLGDGDTTNDIQGADIGTADYDFSLRAERSGGGSGRVYTVVYRITDAEGASTLVRGRVVVPHDNSGK